VNSPAGFNSRPALGFLQAADSLSQRTIEARAAGCHVGDNSGTQAPIPEFLQVVGDGCDRIAAALRREELAIRCGRWTAIPVDRVLARDSNDEFVNTDQQAGVTSGFYSA
jgi:hypothetical protein